MCNHSTPVLGPKAGPRAKMPSEADPFKLRPTRVHEAEGRGRRAFALFQAARHPGPLVWILPAHVPEVPMLRGLPQRIGERLHLLRPSGEGDLLWCIEETLRAAAINLVIAEPEKPLSFLAGRRQQLAAEAGRTTGLMLIQTDAGSNAAETRWHCQAHASPADSTLHRWNIIKNKSGTCKDWTVSWKGTSPAFHMVSAARERHEPTQPPC